MRTDKATTKKVTAIEPNTPSPPSWEEKKRSSINKTLEDRFMRSFINRMANKPMVSGLPQVSVNPALSSTTLQAGGQQHPAGDVTADATRLSPIPAKPEASTPSPPRKTRKKQATPFSAAKDISG
jgi:hypothetical protein